MKPDDSRALLHEGEELGHEARAQFTAGNPQGRIVQPREVADAVRWLCGDAAASVTGQSISVSGGEVMQ